MSMFAQNSFRGGMNLLANDTSLIYSTAVSGAANNQYRIGFNVRNRFDYLIGTLSSVKDPALPVGIVQEAITFGNYIIVFISGLAYYRYYTDTGWQQIPGFSMNASAPRLWSVAVPISTTNFYRVPQENTANSITDLNIISGAAGGGLPGLLVQDNINQPQFIYIDSVTGKPVSKVTQTFSQWSITFTDPDNTTVVADGDKREYVPIGNLMEFTDGILYIVSQDSNYIYRSVEGRPLDFMVNVKNELATDSPFKQTGGGDATTTSYSVGVGGISCIKGMSDGSLFVSASNANFLVTKNKTPGALQVFGQYTFIRTFLFNATCLSDRTIIDSLGDTKFIDLTGVRSFNAILQTQNEGRNSQFTSKVQPAFNGIVQDSSLAAAILYDNYELYAMDTTFGAAIAVYDTILDCWTSFDTTQTGGSKVKKLVKIELSIQRLYAVTEDNKLYTLYIGPNYDTSSVRFGSVCSGNAKVDTKMLNMKVVFDNITQESSVSCTPFVDNRISKLGTISKSISYSDPTVVYVGVTSLPEINTQLTPVTFAFPSIDQGWKSFCLVLWNSGTISQTFIETEDINMQNSLAAQRNVK